MVITFFVAGDRCEVICKTKGGGEIIKLGTVTKFTYPWRHSPRGCVEGLFDDGGTFCGEGSNFKKYEAEFPANNASLLTNAE
ncbi:hypothetical protein QT972_25455 [Microcoleus sp. herbarium7]|uniref:hypothetical protein n=1 Tax=Microcoleus sp. herbarium7 TaxID=3055435 RepID=UPI002FD79E8A